MKRDLSAIRKEHEVCRSVIDDFKPEVIHLNTSTRSILGFVLEQRGRWHPTLLTAHDHGLFQNRQGIGQTILENVDAVAVISESVKMSALNQDIKLDGKLQTVLNALPMPDLPPAAFPLQPRLLCFGRLVVEKGFDLAIRAFAAVAGHFPAATLTVAGHGNQYARLQRLADESGFAERIHFPGWVDPEGIPALINQHSVVIMPSRWQEPFGLVALQTAQMGRPILASRVGGIPEIVRDGETGRLYENENLPELQEGLRYFLQNPEQGKKMGEQAFKHAQAQFGFEAFLDRYEKIYTQIKRR